MINWISKLNYSVLLVLLVADLALQPILSKGIAGSLISNALFTAIILISIYIALNSKRLFFILLIPSILAIATRWAAVLLGLETSIIYFSAIVDCIVLSIACIVIATQIFKIQTVNYNVLSGSVTLYLLIGFAFAFLHLFAELLQPGSYTIAENLSAQSHSRYGFSVFIYYSIVTLTTLGFGDISPISHFARNITMLEAVIGQMFIAILIGRLIGLSLLNARKDP